MQVQNQGLLGPPRMLPLGGEGAGERQALSPGYGEESMVTFISCIGLQVTFLLPALDKTPIPAGV